MTLGELRFVLTNHNDVFVCTDDGTELFYGLPFKITHEFDNREVVGVSAVSRYSDYYDPERKEWSTRRFTVTEIEVRS